MQMRAVLAAPLVVLPGDMVSVDGRGRLRQVRGNATVLTLDLLPLSTPFHGFVFGNQIPATHIYWSRDMADAIVRTIKSVVKNPDDSYDITFTNDTGRHFNDIEQIVTATNYLDREGTVAEDIAVRSMVLRSPDGTNFQAFVGTKVSIDMLAAQAITITLPE